MEIDKDIESFFEKNNSPLYIWGAGNAGFWLAYYFEKCDYLFEGYIDKNVLQDKGDFFDKTGYKQIIHPLQLSSIPFKSIRIIIAVQNTKVDDVLKDICLYVPNQLKVRVLYPFSKDVTESNVEVYNINEVLSYFRKKIIKKPIPSVISNNCGAGFIYRMLGVEDSARKSPTVSSVIFPDDYIKIVKNPRKYLSQKISFSHWTCYWAVRMPVGRIDDIQVFFIHDKNEVEPIERWNTLIEHIDYSNLFFLFEDHMYRIPNKEKRAFLETEYPHLLVLQNDSLGEFAGRRDVLLTHNAHLHVRGSAIENSLDLLDILNLE